MAAAITLRTLDIDWAELEVAYRDSAAGMQSYLDTASGELLDTHDPADSEQLAADPDRFAPVPVFSARDGIEVLRAFVEQLPQGPDRRLLARAARGPGALARCEVVLARAPRLGSEFRLFEEQVIAERLLYWLAALGLRARAPHPRLYSVPLVSAPS